jgi:hypothetical protein
LETNFKTVSKNGCGLVNDTLATPIEEVLEKAKKAAAFNPLYTLNLYLETLKL